MNILALSYGHSLGGAQISTLEFIEHLRKEVNIRVITCEDTEKSFLERLRNLNIGYRLVPCSMSGNITRMGIDTIEDWLKWADIMWVTDGVLMPPHVKNVKNIPVVVHLHSYPLLCPWWGLLYGMREVCYEGCSVGRIVRCKQLFNKELSKLGIIGTVKSNLYQVLDLAKGPFDYFNWRRNVNKEVLDSIDGFIAVSNFVKKIHEELLAIEGKPIEVIYNPVTHPLEYAEKLKESMMSEYSDENLIVYASGSNPVKGPHLLLQALKILLDEEQNIKLVMFGCKGTWVERYTLKLGLKKNVVFLDKSSPSILYKTILKANVTVMPSLVPESFGRIPVESNRLGVPAVATRRGGLPETIMHGETGTLVEPIAEEIARGILKALTIERGAEITMKSLRAINPEESLRKFLKLLERLI